MVMTTIAENDVLACNNASYVYVFDSCLNSLLDGHVMGNLEPGNVNEGSSRILESCTPMVLNFFPELSSLDRQFCIELCINVKSILCALFLAHIRRTPVW